MRLSTAPFPGHDPLTMHRRRFLQAAGLGCLSWLTPLGHLLAEKAEREKSKGQAQSVIILWMSGGPSQLETFDPHPGTEIAAGSRAIPTAVKGVQLADGLPQVAEQMSSLGIVRSVVSKEGDHERATYNLKTGYRPDPTLVHPAIGAICCHELPIGKTEVPRHVSIAPNQWPARGGFLGDEFDAFKVHDTARELPDVVRQVSRERDEQRSKDLEVVERAFARGREKRVEATLHRTTMDTARTMMNSDQLRAFDTSREPADLRKAYGDNPFGRGCLAARRLIEVGVRCVEVTLDGWDTHVNNHELVQKQVAVLDPAFAALVRDLKERDLLGRTIVMCLGEFGRTPKVNPLGGRDHWPTGFSVALAGGGLRPGMVVGETDTEGGTKPADPVSVGDIHATVLTALGIDPHKTNISPIQRPIRLADGDPIRALLG